MSTTESLPLAGAMVIVTRPSASAGAQVRAARQLGARVLRLPGIGLRHIEDRRATARALEAAMTADAWIFTSPAAVRFAFAVYPALRPGAATGMFAVGAGSARALAARGFVAVHPQVGQDSEGLLAMSELASPHGRSIAIIDAPGGRDLIAPMLRQRGAHVERIHVYRRTPPRLDRRHFEALARAAAPWLTLLSSGEALVNLVAVLPPESLERWRFQPLIVSSARLAVLAATHGFSEVRTAPSALSRDLINTACLTLQRHRM